MYIHLCMRMSANMHSIYTTFYPLSLLPSFLPRITVSLLTIFDRVTWIAHIDFCLILNPVDCWRRITNGFALHYRCMADFDDTCAGTLSYYRKTGWRFITCKYKRARKNNEKTIYISMYLHTYIVYLYMQKNMFGKHKKALLVKIHTYIFMYEGFFYFFAKINKRVIHIDSSKVNVLKCYEHTHPHTHTCKNREICN